MQAISEPGQDLTRSLDSRKETSYLGGSAGLATMRFFGVTVAGLTATCSSVQLHIQLATCSCRQGTTGQPSKRHLLCSDSSAHQQIERGNLAVLNHPLAL